MFKSAKKLKFDLSDSMNDDGNSSNENNEKTPTNDVLPFNVRGFNLNNFQN